MKELKIINLPKGIRTKKEKDERLERSRQQSNAIIMYIDRLIKRKKKLEMSSLQRTEFDAEDIDV